MATNWVGRSQLRFLRWLSSTRCESSLLLLISVGQTDLPLQFLWVLALCACLSHFQFFCCCRDLDTNALTGTIPPQISTLTNLVSLYAPKRPFVEYWSYASLSVGLAHLFLSLSSFFLLTGTSPPTSLMAQSQPQYRHWSSWLCCASTLLLT